MKKILLILFLSVISITGCTDGAAGRLIEAGKNFIAEISDELDLGSYLTLSDEVKGTPMHSEDSFAPVRVFLADNGAKIVFDDEDFYISNIQINQGRCGGLNFEQYTAYIESTLADLPSPLMAKLVERELDERMEREMKDSDVLIRHMTSEVLAPMMKTLFETVALHSESGKKLLQTSKEHNGIASPSIDTYDFAVDLNKNAKKMEKLSSEACEMQQTLLHKECTSTPEKIAADIAGSKVLRFGLIKESKIEVSLGIDEAPFLLIPYQNCNQNTVYDVVVESNIGKKYIFTAR